MIMIFDMDAPPAQMRSIQNMTCPLHPSEKITFACISHQQCPNNNLLCVQCIDDLNAQNLHHLISLKKFQKFVSQYQKHAESSFDRTRSMINQIRSQINSRINQLEVCSLSGFEVFAQVSDHPTTQFREKIKILAGKKIWFQIQSQKPNAEQLQDMILRDVQSNQNLTTEVLNQLLKFASECFRNIEQSSPQQKKVQQSSTNFPVTRRLRKRANTPNSFLQHSSASNQLKSSHSQVQEKPNDQEGINEDQDEFDSEKMIKKVKFKRYTQQEKQKILSEIHTQGKRAVVRRHKIANSTLLRWEKEKRCKTKRVTKRRSRKQQSKPINKDPPNEIKIEDSSENKIG